MSKLIPRQPVPDLSAPVVSQGQWTLNAEPPEHFTLLVFYRGLHCPLCRKSLEQLNGLIKKFEAKGVRVIALSCDKEQRAVKTREDWDIDQVPIGYGMSIEEARKWGLFISSGLPDSDEPKTFSEPGLFLVKPDGTLFMSSINSAPFARPRFEDMLDAVQFVLDKSYPPRGES